MGDSFYKGSHQIFRQRFARTIGTIGIALYDALLSHCNAKHQCWPSIPTLAGEIGVVPNTVRRYLRVLVRERLVGMAPRNTRHGGTTSNLFTILPVPDAPLHVVNPLHQMHPPPAPDAP